MFSAPFSHFMYIKEEVAEILVIYFLDVMFAVRDGWEQCWPHVSGFILCWPFGQYFLFYFCCCVFLSFIMLADKFYK